MPNSPKLTFRCPTRLLERLTQHCQDLGVRQSTAIVMILEAALSDTPMTVGQPEPDDDEGLSDTVMPARELASKLALAAELTEHITIEDHERLFAEQGIDLTKA